MGFGGISTFIFFYDFTPKSLSPSIPTQITHKLYQRVPNNPRILMIYISYNVAYVSVDMRALPLKETVSVNRHLKSFVETAPAVDPVLHKKSPDRCHYCLSASK